MKLHYLLLVALFLSACSTHTQVTTIKKPTVLSEKKTEVKTVLDLEKIPQTPSFYTQNIDEKKFSLDDFYKKYFRVWKIKKPSESLTSIMWAHKSFTPKNSYGENLQPISQDFFDTVLENSNFAEFATLNRKALSLDLLNMRVFPTQKPLFRDPSRAGEGFPFDYMQNSSLAANKPLLVSHYSKDKKWVFVESSFAFGWVQSKDIAFVQEDDAALLQSKEQVFIVREGVPIYSQDGEFLFYSRIGMLFAFIDEDSNSYTVLSPLRTRLGEVIFTHSKILKTDANRGALAFNGENIQKILEEIYPSKYGWGGMYEERDCSSTLRDFYAPFGLWLPRNSSAQAQKGVKISLENLSEDAKKETIKKHAVPFETLLYKKGHIVIYVGNYNDEIIIFQNVWGVKTEINQKEGRFIVGKTLFSTLELGKELEEFDQKSSLLKNLKSMNLLTQ